mgnify:CR=1 FL=1
MASLNSLRPLNEKERLEREEQERLATEEQERLGREEQERLEKFVAIRVGQGNPITGTYPPNDATRTLYQDWIKRGEPAEG